LSRISAEVDEKKGHKIYKFAGNSIILLSVSLTDSLSFGGITGATASSDMLPLLSTVNLEMP
jgi:hypothetical protein